MVFFHFLGEVCIFLFCLWLIVCIIISIEVTLNRKKLIMSFIFFFLRYLFFFVLLFFTYVLLTLFFYIFRYQNKMYIVTSGYGIYLRLQRKSDINSYQIIIYNNKLCTIINAHTYYILILHLFEMIKS